MKPGQILAAIKTYIDIDKVNHVGKSRISDNNIIKLYYNDEADAKKALESLPQYCHDEAIAVSGRGVIEERKDYAAKFGKYSLTVTMNHNYHN